VPAPSLDDFGPRDAIISIQERLRRRRRPGGYADRQRPLRLPPLDPHYPRGYPTSCTRPRWIAFHGFRDAGRNFYAFAAVGRAASAETRRDTRRVLESLAFEHPERGYAIDLPEGWQRAERTIVPLTDPGRSSRSAPTRSATGARTAWRSPARLGRTSVPPTSSAS
jgi:hypothetical protein